jgi:hypothetical protein
MPPRSPFEYIDIDKELVCEFFGAFSRFEFALKETGFVFDLRGRAAPDWQTFSRVAGERMAIAPGTALATAIQVLTEQPPQIQSAQLKWFDRPLNGTSDTARAVDAATRVRNNLFHGGKHPPYSAPGRDAQLLRAALTLLYACLEQIPELFEHYDTTVF